MNFHRKGAKGHAVSFAEKIRQSLRRYFRGSDPVKIGKPSALATRQWAQHIRLGKMPLVFALIPVGGKFVMFRGMN